MKRLWRLLYYARRYWLQALSAVVLAAGVGLLDAFRVLLIGPIFDNVLHPGTGINPAKQSPLPAKSASAGTSISPCKTSSPRASTTTGPSSPSPSLSPPC